MLLIVKVSVLLTLPTVRVTVRFELVTAMLAALILALAANDTLPAPALNRQPLGAVSIKVTPLPVAKSPFAPSVMTMLPKVVNAGAALFWALSAERLVPPVAGVTVTVA